MAHFRYSWIQALKQHIRALPTHLSLHLLLYVFWLHTQEEESMATQLYVLIIYNPGRKILFPVFMSYISEKALIVITCVICPPLNLLLWARRWYTLNGQPESHAHPTREEELVHCDRQPTLHTGWVGDAPQESQAVFSDMHQNIFLLKRQGKERSFGATGFLSLSQHLCFLQNSV